MKQCIFQFSMTSISSNGRQTGVSAAILKSKALFDSLSLGHALPTDANQNRCVNLQSATMIEIDSKYE